ncbi:MAG: cell wall hydrolase [Gluconacetobacter diazotrophicus]|nr:cell wall hydrolase [Gluconacetobacter diazotrophicus]
MPALLGLLAGQTISNLALPVVNRLVGLIPDPERRAEEADKAAGALLDADLALSQRQTDINLVEARSENLFVSGWRPFIGWSCGLALLWQILLAPFVIFNCAVFGYHPAVPELDKEWMSLILVPLLGLGVMRSVEKIQRVAGPLMGTPKPAPSPVPVPIPVPATVPVAGADVVDLAVRRTALAGLLARSVGDRPVGNGPVGGGSVGGGPAGGAPRTDEAGTRDVLARTLWGEARGEGRGGMEAVASVICRRAAFPRWWGHDVRSVCLSPHQFSCWLPGDPNRNKLQAVDAADESFAAALEIAGRAMANAIEDRTGQADSYADLAVAHPPWARVAKQTAVIGRHTFFRLET